MKLLLALAGGLAGSLALTFTHQLLHHFLDDAPRMDLMGEEALSKIAEEADVTVPSDNLYGITMAGDIAGNTLYYALGNAGSKKNVVARSTALGLLAGIGGVCLPKHIGLTNAYSNRTVTTAVLTIGIYTLGGWITGKTLQKLNQQRPIAKTS